MGKGAGVGAIHHHHKIECLSTILSRGEIPALWTPPGIIGCDGEMALGILSICPNCDLGVGVSMVQIHVYKVGLGEDWNAGVPWQLKDEKKDGKDGVGRTN